MTRTRYVANKKNTLQTHFESVTVALVKHLGRKVESDCGFERLGRGIFLCQNLLRTFDHAGK